MTTCTHAKGDKPTDNCHFTLYFPSALCSILAYFSSLYLVSLLISTVFRQLLSVKKLSNDSAPLSTKVTNWLTKWSFCF